MKRSKPQKLCIQSLMNYALSTIHRTNWLITGVKLCITAKFLLVRDSCNAKFRVIYQEQQCQEKKNQEEYKEWIINWRMSCWAIYKRVIRFAFRVTHDSFYFFFFIYCTVIMYKETLKNRRSSHWRWFSVASSFFFAISQLPHTELV